MEGFSDLRSLGGGLFKSVIGDLNILWASQLALVVKNLPTSAGV